MTKLGTGIYDLLEEVTKTASAKPTKAAAEVPATEAPVGKATDKTETTPTEGSHAQANSSDSQAATGTVGVESATGKVVPKEEENTHPQRIESTVAGEPPPSDITPGKTVKSEGTDSDTKSAGANLVADINKFLNDCAILPKEAAETPAETEEDKKKKEKAKGEATPPGVKPPGEPVKVEKEAADNMLQVEAFNKQRISDYINAAGLTDASPENEKSAAVVGAILGEYDAMVDGFLTSLNPNSLVAAIKAAAEGNSAMPETMPSGDAGAGDPGAAAAAAGAGDPGAAAGGAGEAGNPQVEKVLELIAAVQSGKMPPEAFMQALVELGIPQNEIQAIMEAMQEAGAGGAGGAAGAGGEGGGSPPPSKGEGEEAGQTGETSGSEAGKSAAVSQVRTQVALRTT